MRIAFLLGLVVISSLICRGQSGDATPLISTSFDPGVAVDEMPPERLAELIGSPVVFIFDCNDEYVYAESHVPGAVLIPYDDVTIDKLPADRNVTLVFYCYSPECPASHMAAATARELGYSRSYFMKEGIIGWEDAGMPTEP